MKRKTAILILIFSAIFLLPSVIEACPLCQGGAEKDTDFAYKGITLFLALLPILGGCGIFYWFYHQNKKLSDNNN